MISQAFIVRLSLVLPVRVCITSGQRKVPQLTVYSVHVPQLTVITSSLSKEHLLAYVKPQPPYRKKGFSSGVHTQAKLNVNKPGRCFNPESSMLTVWLFSLAPSLYPPLFPCYFIFVWPVHVFYHSDQLKIILSSLNFHVTNE